MDYFFEYDGIHLNLPKLSAKINSVFISKNLIMIYLETTYDNTNIGKQERRDQPLVGL